MSKHRIVYSSLLLVALCFFSLCRPSAALDLTGEWQRTSTGCLNQSMTQRVWLSHTQQGFVGVMLNDLPCWRIGTVAFHAHETFNQFQPVPAWVSIGSANYPSQVMQTAKWSATANQLTLENSSTTYVWTRVQGSGPIGLGGQAVGLNNLSATCKNTSTGQNIAGRVLADSHVDCDALPAAPGESVQVILKGKAQ